MGTVVSLMFVPWSYTWRAVQPVANSVSEQLQTTLDYGFDGVVVYVQREGEQGEVYAAGTHCREGDLAADPKAYFKIASIQKLYTAVIVAQLATEGKLHLDGTLDFYFPEFSAAFEYSDEITVRALVQHRSGLPNYTDLEGYWLDPATSRTEAISRVAGHPANFVPNRRYQYSNTNFALLELLIEKVTGGSYFQSVQERILAPLKLQHTFESASKVSMDSIMCGYYVGYEGDLRQVEQGMVATAEDVGRFVYALNKGTLLDEATQQIYSTLYDYGHTGLVPGYQSIARYYADLDAVVVQFTNTTDFEGDQWALSELGYQKLLKVLRKIA